MRHDPLRPNAEVRGAIATFEARAATLGHRTEVCPCGRLIGHRADCVRREDALAPLLRTPESRYAVVAAQVAERDEVA